MNLVVEKSTASSNGGYVTTLKGQQTIETALGKSTRNIRFLFKADEEIKAGKAFEIDLVDFDVVPIKSSLEDGTEITNTWLMPKLS